MILIFSFNYRRHIFSMAFPAMAIMTAPFVEQLGEALIEVRWVIDLIEVILVFVAVVLWIVILRKEKKAILRATQNFLGDKNAAAYIIISKSLCIIRFRSFELNDAVLEDIKNTNDDVEFAIAQINRIIFISTFTVFGSIIAVGLLASLYGSMF